MATRKNKFHLEKYAAYDDNSNKSTCLVETCKRELSGKSPANIKRHYKLIHKQEIDNNDDSESDVSCNSKKRKSSSNLSTSLDKGEFLRCCVGLVTTKNIPFRIFDDQEYFKRLIAPYEYKFGINLNSQNIGNILEKTRKNINEKIAELVKNKMISLKIDIATRMERSVLGINIQYIKDFRVHVNTIGMIETTKRHTAANLKEEIIKCLQEYSININQIYSNTTDNGANVVKLSKHNILNAETDNAPDDFQTEHIESQIASVVSVVRCAAYTIQLVAYDVLKTIREDIEDCRRITKKLRTSIRAENNAISLPCLDNATGWNSTYVMINSILDLKDYIDNLDNSKRIDINWSFIKDFVSAFQPIAKCTLKLQYEQYIIGDFFRDWLACELELEQLISTNLYAKGLLIGMKKRKEMLLDNNAFLAALYLDPRFNFHKTPLLSNDQKQIALDHLIKTYESICKLESIEDQNDSNSCIISSETPTNRERPTASTSLYHKLTLHVQSMKYSQGSTMQNVRGNINQKLSELCEGDMEPFDSNILEYWRKFYRHDTEMLKLAEVVLAVPATPVSLERAFSALSTILTKSRTRMSKKSLSNLLITKLNFELLDFLNLDVGKDE